MESEDPWSPHEAERWEALCIPAFPEPGPLAGSPVLQSRHTGGSLLLQWNESGLEIISVQRITGKKAGYTEQ